MRNSLRNRMRARRFAARVGVELSWPTYPMSGSMIVTHTRVPSEFGAEPTTHVRLGFRARRGDDWFAIIDGAPLADQCRRHHSPTLALVKHVGGAGYELAEGEEQR